MYAQEALGKFMKNRENSHPSTDVYHKWHHISVEGVSSNTTPMALRWAWPPMTCDSNLKLAFHVTYSYCIPIDYKAIENHLEGFGTIQ